MTLPDLDREHIARARKLADLDTLDAIRQHTGEDDTTTAMVNLLGETRWLLCELANAAERLGAETSRLRNDRARYRIQLKLERDDDDREALRDAGAP